MAFSMDIVIVLQITETHNGIIKFMYKAVGDHSIITINTVVAIYMIGYSEQVSQ